MVIYCFGTCAGYLNVIGDYSAAVMHEWSTVPDSAPECLFPSEWWCSRIFLMPLLGTVVVILETEITDDEVVVEILVEVEASVANVETSVVVVITDDVVVTTGAAVTVVFDDGVVTTGGSVIATVVVLVAEVAELVCVAIVENVDVFVVVNVVSVDVLDNVLVVVGHRSSPSRQSDGPLQALPKLLVAINTR